MGLLRNNDPKAARGRAAPPVRSPPPAVALRGVHVREVVGHPLVPDEGEGAGAGPPVDGIGGPAAAGLDAVVAGLAVDQVAAGAAVQEVVARAAEHVVHVAAAVEAVVAGAA